MNLHLAGMRFLDLVQHSSGSGLSDTLLLSLSNAVVFFFFSIFLKYFSFWTAVF